MGRISQRIAAIKESATLAVDARAKALQAAGEDVIGFGAGEPDFPTPAHIVDAAVAACRDPRNHRYTPTRRAPRAPRGDRAQDQARLRLRRRRGTRCSSRTVASTRSTRRSRCCSTPATRCSVPAPYWTTYPEAITLAGGVPVVVATGEASGVPGHDRPARRRAHAPYQGAAVRVAEQPDRRGVPARRGRGDRPLGRRARHLGDHRRDLRAPHVRRAPLLLDADDGARARRPLHRPQRRRQDLRDDGLAGRLDDRARSTSPRPRSTSSRTPPRTCPTSRSAPRSRRSPATSSRSGRCATRSSVEAG